MTEGTNHVSVSFTSADTPHYTYKNTDMSIMVGDMVEVDARGSTKTARVVAVGVTLDPNARFEYKAILGREHKEEGTGDDS